MTGKMNKQGKPMDPVMVAPVQVRVNGTDQQNYLSFKPNLTTNLTLN